MTSFSQVYDVQNLQRAYRWVLSSSDTRYKNYFREGYAAYALASAHNLHILHRQIQHGSYLPSHASKVYLPKTSGILRPISLLTINDQIAYQACVNVIAKELQKRVRKRRLVTVFYHLYAGDSSPFFYLRWQRCYSSYANTVRRNFANGYKYVATFDMTAFYNSIDHHVLKVFLNQTRIDPDTTQFLVRNLKHWTEATWSVGRGRLIYHEHGIPQGPSCSGMLSKVVLQHLDTVGDRKSKDVRARPGSLDSWRGICSKSPEHDADHGEAEECSNGRCVAFEVASQATVTTDPRERSFDDPPFRQHLKSSSVRSLDDLQAPGTSAPHRHRHLASRVSAVSKNAFDERE